MHRYVDSIVDISKAAVQAIEQGDAVALAEQMTQAQRLFDTCCQPNSPDQLAAPHLHMLMSDEILRSCSLAVKGVGSQGDGSAQILCANSEMQNKVMLALFCLLLLLLFYYLYAMHSAYYYFCILNYFY